MSRKYGTPERRIPLRRKPKMCQYPKCKKEATHTLGLNDPDSDPNYYCEKHCDMARINTLMEICSHNTSEENQ